jgi:hypothetical protein
LIDRDDIFLLRVDEINDCALKSLEESMNLCVELKFEAEDEINKNRRKLKWICSLDSKSHDNIAQVLWNTN